MSAEQPHVTKENAVIGTISGVLLGAGVIFPPALGLGAVVGTVGFIRQYEYDLNVQTENLKESVNRLFEQATVPNPYANLDNFRREAFKRIPGVVVKDKKWNPPDDS